jgi:hypothetical protein
MRTLIVVHQIWLQGRDAVPPVVAASMRTWRDAVRGRPGYEYRFWDDAAVRAILPALPLPQIAAIYGRTPAALYGIRADIARLVVLYHCGGVYADADTRVLDAARLFDHVDVALPDAVVVGTADVRAWTRTWTALARRPSNFLLACRAASPFVARYLASIADDFGRRGFGERLARADEWSLWRTLRVTKRWTGPRKLRALLRSANADAEAVRPTPIGFVASGRQRCFPHAALAHDYAAHWYAKSPAWQRLRDWTVYGALSTPLDACLLGLVLAAALLTARACA